VRAKTDLLDSILEGFDFLHVARARSVRFGVEALLKGQRLVLTALGRASRGRVAAKHCIKRIDRLLGNRAIVASSVQAFARLAKILIGTRPRPIVIIDWTPLGRGSLFHALVASVPLEGRALVIYAEVWPLSKLGNRAVEQRFVSTLVRKVLPPCKPIIVTDAGFRNPWFQALQKLGVDFVGRLRHRALVQLNGSPWIAAKSLHDRATKRPTNLGSALIARSRPVRAQLVLVRKPRKHRVRRTTRGKIGDSVADWRGQDSAREPWLLMTSLSEPPARVIANYAKRMQTEETFRDLKNHRFGWSLEDARCTTCQRWQTLLLIAAIASLVVVILGFAAENVGYHRFLMANTSKRRVFSLFVLGTEVLREPQYLRLDLRAAAQIICAAAG